jgi:oxygen-independent coproporphyrinogen-3 oxidase
LGFGPGAHSFDGKDRRFANIADIHRYQQRVEFEQSVIEKEWLYDSQTRWEDWLSVRLRRKTGVDLQECAREWGSSRHEQLRNAAHSLPSHLCDLSHTHFSLTVEGWFIENEILAKLFLQTSDF